MKSRHAWLLFSLALPVATSSVSAQPKPAPGAPAQAGATAAPPPANVAPVAPPQSTVDFSSGTSVQGAPAVQPPVLPPLRFRTRAPRSHVFRAPPIKAKRRYGNAGAPFFFGIGASLRFRADHGYRQLRAAKQQNEFELTAAYDVYQPVRRLVFAAGLDYRYAALGDSDSLQVLSNAVQLDLIVRYTLATWLFPHLRAGVGAQLTRIDLDDDVFRAHDRTAGATGSVGAGFTLQTPRRLFETHGGRISSLSFGVLLEGGYAFASAADYQLKIKSRGDLPVARIPLGKLDLGGPYLRILGVVRF